MKSIIGVALVSASLFDGGTARLAVKVVDSATGEPIPNVNVHGGFRNYPRGWGISSKDNSDDAVTDRDGMCRLSGGTEEGHASCIIRDNDGYYDSDWYAFDFTERSLLKLGRWLPDDIVVTARLERIINPIPLFVKKVDRNSIKSYFANRDDASSRMKTTSFAASYDFLLGDWLPPYGKGRTADVRVSADTENLGTEQVSRTGIYMKYRTSYRIEFPGDGNGAQEVSAGPDSILKIRTAPEGGYHACFTRSFGWFGREAGRKTDFDMKNRYFTFRIRTEKDNGGKITKAYYGKIHGDLNFTEFVPETFIYYLNPTPNDRNLEFDRKTNLNRSAKDRPKDLAP